MLEESTPVLDPHLKSLNRACTHSPNLVVLTALIAALQATTSTSCSCDSKWRAKGQRWSQHAVMAAVKDTTLASHPKDGLVLMEKNKDVGI